MGDVLEAVDPAAGFALYTLHDLVIVGVYLCLVGVAVSGQRCDEERELRRCTY